MKIRSELTQCNKVAAMKLGHNGEIKVRWSLSIVDPNLITTDCLYDAPTKLSLMFKIRKIHSRPLVRAPRMTFFLRKKLACKGAHVESGKNLLT